MPETISPTDALAHVDNRTTERQLQEQLRQLCADIEALAPGSIYHYHTNRSDRSERGFPDSVIIVGPVGKRKRVLWVELKTQKGKLSIEQESWLRALAWAKQEWFLLRPSGWVEFREHLLTLAGIEEGYGT